VCSSDLKIKNKLIKEKRNKEQEKNQELNQQTGKISKNKKYKVIYNGWFDSHYCKFPPPAYIDPIMVSFHINDEDHVNDPRYKVLDSHLIDYRPITSHRSYLIENGPIGCRDQHTKNTLDQFNIPCYFSACLTLTLKRPPVAKTNDILVVDANNIETDAIFIKIPKNIRDNAIYISQALIVPLSNIEKMRLARKFLEQIASAKLIITNRLHTLLPALAFHVPVIFITADAKNSRFAGLLCCPIYDGKKEFEYNIDEITWDYMVQNHGVAELLGHAQKMSDIIARKLKM